MPAQPEHMQAPSLPYNVCKADSDIHFKERNKEKALEKLFKNYFIYDHF